MTRLITSILDNDVDPMLARARRVLDQGADMTELRLDGLDETPAGLADRVVDELPIDRCLITVRSRGQGGRSTLDSTNVLALLDAFGSNGAAIDVEADLLDSPETSDLAFGLLRKHADRTIIVSQHFIRGGPDDPAAEMARIETLAPGCIAKLAWTAQNISDNFDALELLHESPGKRIAICMGENGLMSRVLAGKCQAFGTFCATNDGASAAPGQVSLGIMRDLYRVDRMTVDSELFGVIGSPVGHSLSPLVFNRQFARDGINAVYLPLRIDDEAELIAFLNTCRKQSWLNARGFSVTLPHKRAAMQWAGSGADKRCHRLGAANTLYLSDDGVRAANTDYDGVAATLDDWAAAAASKLSGINAAVLGAGGVARAVVAVLCDRGANVTIYNRTLKRGEALAAEFQCRVRPWDQRLTLSADLIINCTQVGMAPHTDQSPLAGADFQTPMTIFDSFCRPMETRLLRDAQKAGCHTISGACMFVHQAACQYRIWTGRPMNTEHATRLVTDALTNETGMA